MAQQERLIIAVPAGPQVPGDPRHSEGSRLAEPTHRLLRKGAGLNYELVGRQLSSLIRRSRWEITEFRGSDIPKAVAEGDADAGITGSDKVLNLPDKEFDEQGELRHVAIIRKLRYGICYLTLGIPETLGYSEDAKLEIAEGLVVGVGLEYLVKRICRARGVTPAGYVVRGGHVENTLRRRAQVIVDISETGGTMRDNHIIPAERLLSFQALLVRNNRFLGRSKEEMLSRFVNKIDIALTNPGAWMTAKEIRDRYGNDTTFQPSLPSNFGGVISQPPTSNIHFL